MRSWKRYVLPVFSAALLVLCTVVIQEAQAQSGTGNSAQDPGIRVMPNGAANPGNPLPGLTAGELDFFNNLATPTFMEIENLEDGLGPRYNLDSCASCHIHPTVGGSSPPTNNPQVVQAQATGLAAQLANLPFITINGPVREARFVRNPNGTADGGVHALFTVVGHINPKTGQPDTPPGCNIAQPNFQQQIAANNIVFRIPTPLYGAGLMEAITDATLRNNLASDPGGRKRALGIRGRLNTNDNDGTITRFGWKAQNKSLMVFAGEAYNVEMGITNENFNTEREENPNCAVVAAPNSLPGFNVGQTEPSDILQFTEFMAFLDQPQPATTTYTTLKGVTVAPSQFARGRALLDYVGCTLCHTPSLPTGNAASASMRNKTANLFSDMALHNLGRRLADGITQGKAGPYEFRTAPLWGVGQRAFLHHDGRNTDLRQAILEHYSDGSEANQVIQRFVGLKPADQQQILNFLRSL